jgi:hypothetical protein
MHSRAAESEDDYYACPSCDRFFTDYTAYAGPRLDIEDDDMDSPSDSFSQSSRGRKSKKGKGKDKDMDGGSRPGMDQLGFEPKTEGSSWVTMSDNGAFPLAPSAKTATLKAILLQGFEEAPFDKVVIYVQFRLLSRTPHQSHQPIPHRSRRENSDCGIEVWWFRLELSLG